MCALYRGEYHAELLNDEADDRAFGGKFFRYVNTIRPFFPSGRALDIGCSTGLFPRMMRDCGYRAEGLEVNAQTAQWGVTHYGLCIHTGTLEQFSISNGPYDLITMTDVLEHTEDPLRSLGLVNGLLKMDGGAMVTFPDICSVKSRYYRWLAVLTRREWVWTTCSVPHHTWEFTKRIALQCFAKTGFSVISFGRSESLHDGFTGRLALLEMPVRPLSIPFLARRFGTQMEFLLRKTRAAEPAAVRWTPSFGQNIACP